MSPKLNATKSVTLKRALLALGIATSLIGCPPGGGGPIPDGGSACGVAGSCNGGLETACSSAVCCQDYQGGFTPAEGQSSCAAIHGTYSSIPCRATDLVGSCVLYGGTVAQQTVRYYAGYIIPMNSAGAASAQANCDAIHGDWILPGGPDPGNGPCVHGGSDGGIRIDAASDGGNTTFSCFGMNGSNLHCYEWKNVSPAQLGPLMSACNGTPGTGCTTASLVGCCTQTQMVNGITAETCYYAPIDPMQAATACAMQGTWATLP